MNICKHSTKAPTQDTQMQHEYQALVKDSSDTKIQMELGDILILKEAKFLTQKVCIRKRY